jgi:NAD(P)H-dependent FMN reductase
MGAMRVLTICGSWQRGSANLALLDVVTARLHATGASVDSFDAVRDVRAFDAADADDPGAVVAGLRAQIEQADAVVIAAPEYAGALSGSMKNALDWMVGSGSLHDRTVGIASAGTTGGWFARRDIAQTLAWQGALVVAHLGIAAPRTKSDQRGMLTDPATITDIEAFTDALVAWSARSRQERILRAREVAAEFELDPRRVAGGVDE